MLSAHRDKSQGRPRTTPSSQLIGYDGLPVRISQRRPLFPSQGSRRRPTAVSSPDNGNGYRSHAHAALCRRLGIRHLFTQSYRPKTDGKAERFTQTPLGERSPRS